MKLLLAIVRDDYAGEVVAALNESGLSVTRISTTGGFWRRGNVTLLIGVPEEQVDKALEVINSHAGPRIDLQAAPSPHPPHRATIFVLNVGEFAHY
jgi:uncharacterized protein YaaQ